MEMDQVGEPIMAPHVPRGSPIPWVSPCVSYQLPTHKPVLRSIDIDIDIGWPTSLVGGERPGGVRGDLKRVRKYIVNRI